MFRPAPAASPGRGRRADVPAQDVIGGEHGTGASDPAMEQTALRVVQMNSGDLMGRRFNGFDLTSHLRDRGVASSHLVFWNKESDAEFVGRMFPYRGSRYLTRRLYAIERRLSTHARLHPQSWFLPAHARFRAADVAHYHIIHDGYFSLGALPYLTARKPSVWTWHDPWTMTGHCVYPMACERWRQGCGDCPDLGRAFAMKRDRTAEEFRRKQRIYGKTKADVVLASQWMLDMARRSPLGADFNFHLIPFGVDLNAFRPRDREAARQRLGVLPGRKVFCLRAASGPFKGLANIVEALHRLSSDQPLCLITFQETGHFDAFIGTHQIIEHGWTNDEDLLRDAYAACDVFLMPSRAEAFGVMAIEAMACGRPVVCFAGTALPNVTFAPDAGIAVPTDDNDALAAVLRRLIENADECRVRGERSRRLAEEHYGIEQQADRLAALYLDVAARGSK